MMKKWVAVVLTVFFSLVVLGSSVFAGEAKGKDAAAQKEEQRKALFEQKCSQCHAADKIKEGHRTKEDLKKILGSMTSKPKCNINAAEAKEIEIYLLGDMGPAVVPGM
jgi:mono/diheme cytochrome c family protein